jgi:hypothetical protein
VRTVSAAGARAFRLAAAGPLRGRVAGVFGEALALEVDSGEILWLDRRPDALSGRGLLLRGPLPSVTTGSRWRWEGGWLLSADARLCRQAPAHHAEPGVRTPGGAPFMAVRQVVAAGPAEGLAEVARSRGRALAVAIGRGGTGEAQAAALLGLGPGLTPSGDDFLGGFLLARAHGGHADTELRLLVRREAGGATHPISAAKLLDAEAGDATVAEAGFLGAVLSGSTSRALAATARLLRFGATSGADFALGVLDALDLEGAA